MKFLNPRAYLRKYRTLLINLLCTIAPNVQAITFKTTDGRYITTLAKDKYITFDFLKFGDYKDTPIRSVLNICGRIGVSNKIFIDAGANVGTETVYALRNGRFSRAVAIEPELENVRALEMNAVSNGLTDQIAIERCAVSDTPGSMSIKLSRTNAGDHKLVDTTPDNDVDHITVPVKTIDQILAERNIDPTEVGLLFMDVQGHEMKALYGAKSIVTHSIPIAVELTLVEADMNASSMLNYLQPYYDSMYVINNDEHEGPFEIVHLNKVESIFKREHIDVLIFRQNR